MNLTKERRIGRHKDFLKANAEVISAFAWEGYLSEGPGAVLVPEEDFVHASRPELKPLRFHYLPLTSKDQAPYQDVLTEKEIGWLTSYNPDEKIVLCVLRKGDGISSYLFGGRVRPSEAYARKQAKRN
jgi:hypothetical protein